MLQEEAKKRQGRRTDLEDATSAPDGAEVSGTSREVAARQLGRQWIKRSGGHGHQEGGRRWRWLLYALPDHLDMLWEAGASLDVFQQALDDWVRAHEKAAEDCRRQCVAPRSCHERTQRQE
jgi:hypothetical protein